MPVKSECASLALHLDRLSTEGKEASHVDSVGFSLV